MRLQHVVLVLFLLTHIDGFSEIKTTSTLEDVGVKQPMEFAEFNKDAYDSLSYIGRSVHQGRYRPGKTAAKPVEKLLASQDRAHPLLQKALLHYDPFAYVACNNYEEALLMAKREWDSGELSPEPLGIFQSAPFEIRMKVGGVWAAHQSINQKINMILPVSAGGAYFESYMNGIINNSNGLNVPFGRPSIPGGGFEISRGEIADLYKEMGFNRMAVNNYLEAIYSWGLLDGHPESAKMWLKIAQLEEIENQEKLALRAYLQCIFCSDKYQAEAESGIQRLLEGKTTKWFKPIFDQQAVDRRGLQERGLLKPEAWEKKTTTLGWDIEKAKRIAFLHQQSNVHPLGIQALYAAQRATGVSLEKEIKTLTKEWGQIIDSHIEVQSRRTEYQFYGVKVPADDDWTKVKIKRPSDTFWVPEELSIEKEKVEKP